MAGARRTETTFTHRNGFAAGCAAGLAPPNAALLNRAMPLVRALPLFTSTRTLLIGIAMTKVLISLKLGRGRPAPGASPM